MPRVHYPKPKKRLKNRAWEIWWNWNNRRYMLYPGYSREEDDLLVEAELRQVAAALAMPEPVFSDKYAKAPGALAYLKDRYNHQSIRDQVFDFDVLRKTYDDQARLSFSPGWYAAVVGHLDALRKTGGYDGITPAEARQFLASILAKGRKPGTRNRAFIACSGFYKWLVHGEYLASNPFSGIKQLKEERGSDIVHCTPAEREEVIAMALESGWPDWLAIPVAFYTGMRREEVSRLGWEDIRIVEGLIVVRKSKIGKSRVLPLASALEKILIGIPDAKRRGPVVVTPEGIDRLFRLDNLVRHIRRMKRERMLADWSLPRPAPSKSKEYREKAKAWKKAKAVKDAEIAAALERIGWNPFRHTFGSLLAQAGVSIDKISAWMGNTPEVCRRHYAQFVPRDRRDSEIDKL